MKINNARAHNAHNAASGKNGDNIEMKYGGVKTAMTCEIKIISGISVGG
jgi:hypothetical protein